MSKGSNGNSVIIINRKKPGHGAPHGGAWKVAYADFVTAMMAFFLVMWITSQDQKIKENIAAYFSDPIAYAETSGDGMLTGGEGIVEGGGRSSIVEDNTVLLNNDDIRALLEQAGEEISRLFRENAELQQVFNQVEVEITNEGLRIELEEASNATFFELGSANLLPNGVTALETISQVIAGLDFDIGVEGHTDSRPYGPGNNYTNWELSADRANAARRVLEQNGINPTHIVAIRGYADTNLKFPETPEDPRNRRVSIIVFNRVMEENASNISQII